MVDDFSSKNPDLVNKINAARYGKTGKVQDENKQTKINSILANLGKINSQNTNPSGSPQQTHINPDGSGTKVTQKVDKNGNVTTEVVTLGAGGKVLNKNTTVKNSQGRLLQSSNTKYQYDKNGKLIKNFQVTQTQNKKISITNEFNSEGKISHSNKEITTKKNGKTIKTSSETDFHYENGKLVSREVRGKDENGNPRMVKDTYEEDGKTLKTKHYSYYKRGVLHQDYYEGENLKNRTRGGLPSRQVIYEEDGKTVKATIVNEFDNNGVLIGRKKYDNAGKLIEQHDFSKIDGKFDTAYQIGKGDCYLLASINALSQTEAGQKILQQNVKVSVDENGEKVYTISFPGAQIARESLINGTGEVNMSKLPEDKVHIQGSYTVTEAELEEAAKRAGKDYSAGDKDVLLYEIAYEKYRNDVAQTIKDNNLNPRKTLYVAGLGIAHPSQNDTLSGGISAEATFILTGKQSDLYLNPRKAPTCYIDSDMNMHVADSEGNINTEDKAMAVMTNYNGKTPVDEMLDNLREDSLDGKIDNYAATADFIVSTQEVNGEVIPSGGHSLTIVKVTDNEVILSNPWDPDNHISMTIDEFKQAATKLTCMSMTPQQSTNNPQNFSSRLQNLVSAIQSNNYHPNKPIPLSQRQTLSSIMNQYQQAHGIKPTDNKFQKILDKIKQLNSDVLKTENNELYFDAGTKIKLPDLNDI